MILEKPVISVKKLGSLRRQNNLFPVGILFGKHLFQQFRGAGALVAADVFFFFRYLAKQAVERFFGHIIVEVVVDFGDQR